MAEQKADDEKAGHSERHHAKHTRHVHEESHVEGHAREHWAEKDIKKGQVETNAPQHAGASAARSEIKITIPTIRGLDLSAITIFVAVVLLITVIFQANEARMMSPKLDAMATKVVEESKAPVIQVTSIEAACKECSPITDLLNNIKKAKVNITKTAALQSKDSQAQQLIAEYGIKKLPTIIVTGETDKVNLAGAGFTKVNDALVYTQVAPPYFDIATGKVKGLVTVTLVNVSSCKACSDLLPVVQQLRQIIKIGNFKTVDSESAEGKRLVAEYSMARLPGLLLSIDIKEYAASAQIAQAGTVKKDGTIALGANAPYLNTSTGKVVGVVQVILLNDSSCAGCYDPNLHLLILKSNFQIYAESVKSVDANSDEGKALISKYGIKAVPTFLLTGDVAPYDRLRSVWPTVGTVESDGTYIFRTLSAIAGRAYKDLTTGKVEPNIPPQQ